MSARAKIRLVRATSFSAAHRYFNPALSEAENRSVYGSLYREDGFGHNFRVEASVEGAIDSMTGMIVNLTDLDRWLGEITLELDHRNLNDLVPFRNQVVTTESIVAYFFSRLEKLVQTQGAGARLVQVRLYEGDQTWVDCYPNT